MQERRSEQQQHGERRHEDRERASHDPSRQPGPWPVLRDGRAHLPDPERVEARAGERQEGGQQRERRRDPERDDDRAGDPDRAQDHELEEDEPEQPEQDRQAREEHRPPGRGDRRADGILDRLRPPSARGQLLSETARHQQRVVDPEPEAHQRGEVQDEDAHRGQARDDEHARERRDDGGCSHGERQGRRHDRAEHEQQCEPCEGQRDDLAPAEVCLTDRLHIAVERRAAGEADLEPRGVVEGGPDPRQRGGRVVRREIEEDDVVGGVAIERYLPLRDRVGEDASNVASPRHIAHRGACGGLERRLTSPLDVGVKDNDKRRLGRPDLRLEQRPGPGRLEIGPDEAAGTKGIGGSEGERSSRHEDEQPRPDDGPATARGPAAEPLESGHGRAFTGGSSYRPGC